MATAKQMTDAIEALESACKAEIGREWNSMTVLERLDAIMEMKERRDHNDHSTDNP